MVGGRPVYHVTGKVASCPVKLTLIDQYDDIGCSVDYWIDREDNYLLKMSLAGKVVVTGETEGTVDISLTTTFSDYNKPVTIEAPDVTQ